MTRRRVRVRQPWPAGPAFPRFTFGEYPLLGGTETALLVGWVRYCGAVGALWGRPVLELLVSRAGNVVIDRRATRLERAVPPFVKRAATLPDAERVQLVLRRAETGERVVLKDWSLGRFLLSEEYSA
jgi:hypothetical protein